MLSWVIRLWERFVELSWKIDAWCRNLFGGHHGVPCCACCPIGSDCCHCCAFCRELKDLPPTRPM